MTPLAFHAYANLFPLIEGPEFNELAEDIRVNGLRDRIVLIREGDGYQILDGRNRYRALAWLVSTGEVMGAGWAKRSGEGEALSAEELLDVKDRELFWCFEPRFDGDPLTYVLSKNLNRRHLDESQRAMVAADLATLKVGRPSADNSANLRNMSEAQAAEALSVSERMVSTAKSVRQHAAPEIVDAVRQGRLAASAAAELASQPRERQANILQALPRDADGRLTSDVKKALGPVIKEIRAEKVAAKKERRAEREQDLGRKLQALPEKSFGVAIEDFEWHHEVWSAETGMNKHPANHYETASDAVTPEEIVARCAERFACLADDCILFKWTTQPHLAVALRVMELQGFRYVTNLVWNKERPGEARGHGYWFTGEHEICLVGVRGRVVPPATAHFRSNFSAPVGGHSEKPDHLHAIIEFHWPTVPKVEFNARRARPGWTAWGFDAPADGLFETASQAQSATAGETAPASARNEERLWTHPSIEDRHVVSRTREYPDGSILSVATCRCGWIFKAETLGGGAFACDDAVDAHWREVIAQESRSEAATGSHSAAGSEGADAGAQAGDRPAPTPTELPVEPGTVVSDAAVPGRADVAVPPANRPGRVISDADLEIPAFLRRAAVEPELDLARRDPLPAEVVDGAVQTRLPLGEDELALRDCLGAIEAGREVEWSIMRQAIGAGLAHCTSTRIMVTDEGREFLAQLVGSVPAPQLEARA